MADSHKIQLFIAHFLRPLRSSSSRLESSSGQAVVEYLLVLIVTVGMIMGIMYQFNDAFKKYVQNYFGEYVACLLETGELPSLGNDVGVNASVCNASFEPFSLKNGRPLISSSGNSDSPNTRVGNDSTSPGRTPPRQNPSSDGSKITASAAGRNGETTAGSGNDGDSSKNIVGKYSLAPSFNYRTNRKRANGQISISGAQLNNNKKDAVDSTIAKLKNKGGNSNLRQNKLSVDPRAFRKIASTDESINLSFGDYLKYIIIFGLLILILIFFGGQLLQLKKSWDGA